MDFKIWLEGESEKPSFQQLIPHFTQEDPPDYKKIGRYVSQDNYVKAMTRGSKKTELSAEKMVSAPPGSFFTGVEEAVEKIWNHALTVPEYQFPDGRVRPTIKLNLILMVSAKPMPNGKNRHRLLAYYGGMEGKEGLEDYKLTRDIKKSYASPIGGLIMFGGYVTHAWVDQHWRGREPSGFSLFESLREFARMYLGVHGTAPDDDLTSKSYRTSQAKYDYKRYLKWKAEQGKNEV